MARIRPSAGYQLTMALVSLLMVALVVTSLADFWRIDLTWGMTFLFAGAASLFGWLWWRSLRLGLLALVLASLGSVLAIRKLPIAAAWAAQGVAESIELWNSLRLGEFDTTFGLHVGIALLALSALLSGLLIIAEGFGRAASFWSIGLGLLLFGTEWAWFFDKSASYFMLYLVFSLVLWTLGQAAYRDARWLASGRRIGYRSHIATPLAVLLGVALISAVLPSDFAPIHLGELGVMVQEAFPVLKQVRGGGAGGIGGRFSLAATGFSPNLGALGGPVRLDDSPALAVTPQRPLTETLYLRGATFLVYTGRTWEAGESQRVQIPADGNLPTGYAIDVPREYYAVKITPAVRFGRTIFNLLEPMRVDNLKSGYQPDADGNLFADRTIARNESYTVTARLPRYSAEQIRSLTQLEPDSDMSAYLQLPDSLPSRVRIWASSLTAGVSTPYDKAVAIETFLRQMEYDLNVPATPPGRDFVDYFLNDLQKGYCTYYATAMAVLLRELKIPTRLVEGFAVPATTGYVEDPSGIRTYLVPNSQAHAWVEAYFPGYGWVTFDPTPRADLPGIARNLPAPDPSDLTAATAPDQTLEETPAPRPRNLEVPEDLGDPMPIAAEAARQWPWFLTPLLLLILLGFAGYRYLAAQDRLASGEGRSLVQEAWEKTGGLLARFDLGRAPHQTPKEYARAIGTGLPVLRDEADRVADDYTVARYGPASQPIDPDAGERARSFLRKARAELFSRWGWRAYLWRRLRRRR